MLPGVRVGVKEADLEELVEVGLHRLLGHREPTDPGGIKLGVVVDLDAVDPVQHQDAT